MEIYTEYIIRILEVMDSKVSFPHYREEKMEHEHSKLSCWSLGCHDR